MVCPSFESTSQPSPDTAMRSRLSVGSEVRNERIVSGGPEGFGAPNIDLSHPSMTILGRVYAQPRRSFLLLRLGVLHDHFYVVQELLRVVENPVLHHVLHAADALHAVRGVIETDPA